MCLLTLASMVTTGKAFFLCFLLMTRQACGDACGTFHCQDEFGIRMFYAFLAGATVYADLLFFVKHRYYEGLPPLTDFQLDRNASGSTLPDASIELGTDETTALAFSSDEETDIDTA